MMTVIAAMLAAGSSQSAIHAEVGAYRSRGKGKSAGHSARCVKVDQRAAAKNRNRATNRSKCK